MRINLEMETIVLVKNLSLIENFSVLGNLLYPKLFKKIFLFGKLCFKVLTSSSEEH